MWIITSAVWCLKQAVCVNEGGFCSALTALHLHSHPLSFSCWVQSCYKHMVSICLSATGRTVSVVLKRRSLLPRRAGDYLSSAVTLLSAPLSHGALLLKRHTVGFTCQFKMFLVDVLQWRAAEVTERTSAQVSDLNIFHKVENYFIFF